MKNLLVLFAHPMLQKSRVNKILIESISAGEGLTFHDLYQAYPEFDIDVEGEQQLLSEHDIIVFHHPFYWYSTPSILKEWQDLVLEHGWAYGSKGIALKDKILFNVVTSGGRREAYHPQGYNRFTMRMLLAPIEQTANLCKMIFLPPFVVHGTHSISAQSIYKQKDKLLKLYQLLREDKIDTEKARQLDYLNDYLKRDN